MAEEDQVGGGIAALAARAQKADAVGAKLGGGTAGAPAQDLVPVAQDSVPDPEPPVPAAKRTAKRTAKKAEKKSAKPGTRTTTASATTQQRNMLASNATTQQRNEEADEEPENLEDEFDDEEDQEEDDYVARSAKGVIDPEVPTKQLNNRLPAYLKKLLKFAAFEEGITEQQLVIDILKGERPALGDSHPKLYRRFYHWAEEGKLK